MLELDYRNYKPPLKRLLDGYPREDVAHAFQRLLEREVVRLEYEAYASMAERQLAAVADEVARRRDQLLEAAADLGAAGLTFTSAPEDLKAAEAEFAELRDEALSLGFKHVESGPLVRSSYHARDQVPAGSPALRGRRADRASA